MWYIGGYETRSDRPARGAEFPDTGIETFLKVKQASRKELRKLRGFVAGK